MDLVLYVLAALALGLYVGASYARFKRSLADVRGSKTLLAGARKKRTVASVGMLRAGFALVGLVFVFFLGLRAAGKV